MTDLPAHYVASACTGKHAYASWSIASASIDHPTQRRPQMTTILKTIAATALVMATIAGNAHAGGPVITEDTTETAPVVRKKDHAVLLLILGAAMVALIASHGGTVCNNGGEEPTPEEC